MAMDFKTFEQRLMTDPDFKKEVERVDLKRDISRMIIEARIIKGLTQKKLAELVGTKQPSIARLENGKSLPSIKFLKRIADSMKSRLIVTFDFLMDSKQVSSESVTSVASFSDEGSNEKSIVFPFPKEANPSYSAQREFYEQI